MIVDEPLNSATKLREPEIKAALIDALFEDGRIDDATVIISEMPVAAMSRRADIVVANGHLIAFEIKSDGDKTTRLMGQLDTYSKAFEGVVVVTGAKHLDEVLRNAPVSAGIIAIDRIEADLPKARLVRKPRLRNMNIDSALGQMRVADLRRLASTFGLIGNGGCDRFTLERRVRDLPISCIRDAALSAVKDRYRKPFEAFKKARKRQCPTLDALKYLKRPAWNDGQNARTGVAPVAETSNVAELSELVLSVRPRKCN